MDKKDIRNKKYSITDGKILPAFVMFALPLMAASCLMQSYVIADGLILGNAVNEEAIGSVNTVGPIIDLCTLVQIAIAGGCSICISHLFGAKRYNELDKLIDDMYRIIAVMSLAITALAFIGAPWILSLINTPDSLMAGAMTYLRIVFIGVPFTSLYALQSGALRGMGDSKRPLGGIAVSSCVNIGLDLLFVIVFRWGIVGAAVATVTAQTLSAVYLYIKLEQRRRTYTLDPEHKTHSMLGECVRLGAPQIVQSLVTSGGNVLLQNVTNLLGASVVIGVTVAFKVDAILVIPLMCLGQATAVFTGQNMGAAKDERVRKTLEISIAMSISISVVMGIVLWLCGYSLMGLFGLGSEAALYGYKYIKVCMPFYWIFGLQFALNGFLNGAKHTAITAFASIGSLACRVAIAYLGYLSIGATILPIAESASWIVCVIADAVAIICFNRRK